MKEKKTMKGMMLKSGIFFCLIPFLFLWISFGISSVKALRENMESEQKTIVRLTSITIENYFRRMEEEMEKVVSDTKVQKILRTVDRNRYDSTLYNANHYIQTKFIQISLDIDGVKNIVVADQQGGCYSSTVVKGDLLDFIKDVEKLEKETYSHQGKAWITAPLKDDTDALLMVKPIMDMEELQYIGMMYFVVSKKEVKELLSQDSVPGQTAVILENGQKEQLYAWNPEIMTKKDTVITRSDASAYDMSVVTGIENSRYTEPLLKQQFKIFVLFALAAILIFSLLEYIYRKIRGELEKILYPDRKEKWTEETTYYEIRQLNHEMMSLIQKNAEGEKKIVRLMNHCETVNLDKLQAQINPHFLYNTLTSIKYIAIENGQQQISSLITALIHLLRSTINREGIKISLKKEMENARNYMKIQNVIYKGNVSFEILLPEELENCLVPNFIIQPLVENSLFHGIHPEEPGGKIQITAEKSEDHLEITVADNGEGFSEDSLVHMMGAENNREMMTNFGLKGVQQKIQLICGNNYGLSISSTKNQGSRVRICLPCQREEKGGKTHV